MAPGNVFEVMAKARKLDDHHDHEHFACACGEGFHSEEELEAHKKEMHAK